MNRRDAVLKAGQKFELWIGLKDFQTTFFGIPSEDTSKNLRNARMHLAKYLDKLLVDDSEPQEIRELALRLHLALVRQSDEKCYDLWADLKAKLLTTLESKIKPKQKSKPQKTKLETSKKRDRAWFPKALAALYRDSNQSDSKIAATIGVSPSTLSRDPEYQSIRTSISKVALSAIPKGSKFQGMVDAAE